MKTQRWNLRAQCSEAEGRGKQAPEAKCGEQVCLVMPRPISRGEVSVVGQKTGKVTGSCLGDVHSVRLVSPETDEISFWETSGK